MQHSLSRIIGRNFLWLYQTWQRVCGRGFSILIAGAFHEFGRKSVILPPARLSGVGRIVIGSRVYIGAGAWLHVAEPGRTAVPAIKIGSGTSIAGSAVISAFDSVTIGENVLIAKNVYIADHGHRFTACDLPILAQGIDAIAAVTIKAGAWLGQNVVICPGVTVGQGAVIGANSVVKSDVPDFSVAVGAPARIVRTFKNPSEVKTRS